MTTLDEFARLWADILTVGQTPSGLAMRRLVAERAASGCCPLCLEAVASRNLKNHQRGDWCSIRAAGIRADILGLVPAKGIHQRALERACIPFAMALVGKTVSASGNRLRFGAYTLPRVQDLLEATRAGKERDLALHHFRESGLMDEIAGLPPVPGITRHHIFWRCPTCRAPVLAASSSTDPIAPTLCLHVLAAQHAASGLKWAAERLATLEVEAGANLGQEEVATQRMADGIRALLLRVRGAPGWLRTAQRISTLQRAQWVPRLTRKVLGGATGPWVVHLATERSAKPASAVQPWWFDPKARVRATTKDTIPWAYSPDASIRLAGIQEHSTPTGPARGALLVMALLDPDAKVRLAAQEKWPAGISGGRAKALRFATAILASGTPSPEAVATLLDRSMGILGATETAGAAGCIAAYHRDTIASGVALSFLASTNQPIEHSLALHLLASGKPLPQGMPALLGRVASPTDMLHTALSSIERLGVSAWNRLPNKWTSAVLEDTSGRSLDAKRRLLAEANVTPTGGLLLAASVASLSSDHAEVLELSRRFPHSPAVTRNLSRPPILRSVLSTEHSLADGDYELLVSSVRDLSRTERASHLALVLPRLRGLRWWKTVAEVTHADEACLKDLTAADIARELHSVPAELRTEWHTLRTAAEALLRRWSSDAGIAALLHAILHEFNPKRPPSRPKHLQLTCLRCGAPSGAMQALLGKLTCSKCGADWTLEVF